MTTKVTTQSPTDTGTMAELLQKPEAAQLPHIGDLLQAKVLSVAKNEVHLDIDGITTGVVRGRELIDESGEYSDLKVGATVIATLLELENEGGEMELSFRSAGHQKAWDALIDKMRLKEVLEAPVTDANRGGIMVKVGRVEGFLPVSQLTPEHYPRVEGGDKNKIMDKLSQLIGTVLKVKIIDVDEGQNKLIVSERAAWEEKQRDKLLQYKIGEVIKGKATGVVDFGVFVEFGDGLEGLIHISELAWQRIDNPSDLFKVGDPVEATIISIDGTKISLSIKRLKEDPWKKAVERYTVGQLVKGKVIKLNPFGAFVELDKEIHGLAHISELSTKMINHPSEMLKEGDQHEFKILSIEPDNHRLGLSLKAAKPVADEPDAKAKVEEKVDETPTDADSAETASV